MEMESLSTDIEISTHDTNVPSLKLHIRWKKLKNILYLEDTQMAYNSWEVSQILFQISYNSEELL